MSVKQIQQFQNARYELQCDICKRVVEYEAPITITNNVSHSGPYIINKLTDFKVIYLGYMFFDKKEDCLQIENMKDIKRIDVCEKCCKEAIDSIKNYIGDYIYGK